MKAYIKKWIWIGAACFVLLGLAQSRTIQTKAAKETIRVTDAKELHLALKEAKPGDEIVIAEGTYIGAYGNEGSGQWFSWFYSDADGTADNPITLRSENAGKKATLKGGMGFDSGYVLRIMGDYWIIKDIKIKNAQSGIVLEQSSHSQIVNCEVSYVGQEGIQLRGNSSYNTVENCSVNNTGKKTPGYGEAVYVGSPVDLWNKYGSNCNYNVIRGCKLGPNVTAEHVDIKEGTKGTVVENCTMNAVGLSGSNYADSFIDVQGNDAIIRNNTCYRKGNTKLKEAFQVHNQLNKWGRNNAFYDNTLYLDTSKAYILNAYVNTTAFAKGNKRVPDGKQYTGNVTVLDLEARPIPAAVFNTKTKRLTNVEPEMEYSLNRGTTWKRISNNHVNLSKTSEKNLVKYGIWVRRKGDGKKYSNSSIQKITLKQAAPSKVTGKFYSSGTGALIRVNDKMEYRKKGSRVYRSVKKGATAVKGLRPGIYQVRMKATKRKFAGSVVTVTIQWPVFRKYSDKGL